MKLFFLSSLLFLSSSCLKHKNNCERKNLSSLKVVNELVDPYWIFINDKYVCAVLPKDTIVVNNVESGEKQYEAMNTNHYSDTKHGTINLIKCNLSEINIK